MSRLADFRPTAYSFPDSLNLFEGGRDLSSTVRSDFTQHLQGKLERGKPQDCILISKEKIEGSTTLKEAYRPYSGRNYVPTAAARTPGSDGTVNKVKTTKAVHIAARPKTQLGVSQHRMEQMTSYSYQFNGEKSEGREPFRPKSELEGPQGSIELNLTSRDYQKFNYGRPVISHIPDTGLFDKVSYLKGTTHAEHFGSPGYTKSPNLRPKTSVILGKDTAPLNSIYRDHFDRVKEVYQV